MATSAAASSFATGAAIRNQLVKTQNARRSGRRTMTRATATEQDVARVPVQRTTDAVFTDSLAEGVDMVRFVCKERLKFEVEYGMQRGTTDNSYVVKGSDATALLDLPDKSFAPAFAEVIDSGTIDFIVLGHLSPKRVDALAAVLNSRPEGSPAVEVCCSNPAAQVIYAALKPGTPASSDALAAAWKGPTGLRARLRTLRNGDELDLGGGRVLSFVTAPTPRWPDTVVTFDGTSGLLFTSKLFSAHVATAPETPTDAGLGWDEFGADWRFFFDCMLAPMARPTASALVRLEPFIGASGTAAAAAAAAAETAPKSVAPKLTRFLNRIANAFGGSAAAGSAGMSAAAICPLHGPVVKSAKSELVREYNQWVDAQVKRADAFSVAVIYAMAQAIARGITKADVAVEMLNCELSTSEEIEALITKTDGFCLGAPTLGGHMPTPVSNALGVIVKEASREVPSGVFGSFGWSGEAVDLMESRLKDSGFKFAFDPIRCKFKPTQDTLQVCEESGTDLAQAVKKARRQKTRAAQKQITAETGATAGATDTAAAVGRIVGSLCAVTARNGEAQSAMLASWVSQASFNPPALTVAVAKERAVESFLLKGSKFNLNVLQAGNEKEVMKALLKPFAPGENRFGEMEVEISESNGCAVVTEALSCLECEVSERMECGDHWVVLAKVKAGKLLKEDGLTAIHHRKVGTTY